MRFKVGDKVRSKQPGQEYKGIVKKIHSTYILIRRFDSAKTISNWVCRRVGSKVATSDGVWDGKSYLIKLNKCEDIKPELFEI